MRDDDNWRLGNKWRCRVGRRLACLTNSLAQQYSSCRRKRAFKIPILGAVAPLVAWVVHRRFDNWRRILWTWNVIGAVDLIAAVFLGATSASGPLRLFFGEPGTAFMTTLPWLLIPGFLIPLLFAVHIGILVRLASTLPAETKQERKQQQKGSHEHAVAIISHRA